MSGRIPLLVQSNYFSARRETVGGATNALRFFQGKNHILTSIFGPDQGNPPDMSLSIKAVVLPRGDTPNFVNSAAQARLFGRKDPRGAGHPHLLRPVPPGVSPGHGHHRRKPAGNRGFIS